MCVCVWGGLALSGNRGCSPFSEEKRNEEDREVLCEEVLEEDGKTYIRMQKEFLKC